MKVVLFCGGLGMRMRADSQSLPKPMTPIGSRPVLWHVMRYYAHFGHKDFILCLGYGAQAVKDYFLNYRETTSNDFVLRQGGDDVKMLSTDISEWTISFIDTGIDTAIGERLRRVRPYLDGDEIFLANYGDVLTDAPMNDLIKQFANTEAVAQLLAVKPQDSFHVVDIEGDSTVTGLTAVASMAMRINGGYFVFGKRSSTTSIRTRISSWMHACEPPRMAASARRNTTASGRRWTRSRSAARSRSNTGAGTAHGHSGGNARSI